MKIASFEKLLEDQLKDIYSAEQQLAKALPRLAKASKSEVLQRSFIVQAEETRRQIDRLDKIGRALDIKMTGKKCIAMKGLLEEAKEAMNSGKPQSLKDAAIIIAAQKADHYEISAYGSARTFAQQLGNSEVTRNLQASLDEKSAVDNKRTEISVREVLPASCEAREDDSEKPRQGRRAGKKSQRKVTKGSSLRSR